MGAYGSPEYELTWKHWDMPSGPPICRLRASGRRTSGKGFTGWPTPDASVAQDGETFETWEKRRIATKARVRNGNGFGTPLTIAAQMAGWETPMAGSPATEDYNEAGDTCNSRKTKLLVGWNTPRATDGSKGGPNQAGGALSHDANLAGWATPTAPRAHDSDATAGKWYPETKNQTDITLQLLGRERNLFNASTEKRGALNAEFSRWLMGFPPEWGNCAPTATR